MKKTCIGVIAMLLFQTLAFPQQGKYVAKVKLVNGIKALTQTDLKRDLYA